MGEPRLSQGHPTVLSAVQAHQQHPVHAFLVQLAALSLERARVTELGAAHKHFVLAYPPAAPGGSP